MLTGSVTPHVAMDDDEIEQGSGMDSHCCRSAAAQSRTMWTIADQVGGGLAQLSYINKLMSLSDDLAGILHYDLQEHFGMLCLLLAQG
jgi:hypothetical protein